MARRECAALAYEASSPLSGGGSLAPERLLGGEATHLGRLLEPLLPRMTAVALRVTRSPEAADDVVQNALEKAIRRRHQFRGEARLSTWLHRIVVNEALMWLRAERRRNESAVPIERAELPRQVDPEPSAEERLASRQLREQLHRGLAQLRPEEREVLAHCALAECSYDQYGRETGLHPAAVKSRAFRARRHLRACLSPA